MIGQRFERLVVVSLEPSEKRRKVWSCVCDCGESKKVTGVSLRSGNTKSCGCLSNENRHTARVTHGHSKTSIYRVWATMIARCNNPKHNRWRHYGGRGICVCERWLTFENFLADMGEVPFESAQIDRINNDGDYEPSNCRWTSSKQNGLNKSNSVNLIYNGESLHIQEWSKRFGVEVCTIRARLRMGWDIAKAITTRVNHKATYYTP